MNALSQKQESEGITIQTVDGLASYEEQPKPNVLTPDDLPTLLYDQDQRLIAGVKLESQQVRSNQLTLIGWCFGVTEISFLRNDRKVDAEIIRMPRNDVLQAFSATTDNDPGFELSVTDPRPGKYTLRLEISNPEQPVPIDFKLNINIPKRPKLSHAPDELEPVHTKVIENEADDRLKFNIESAVKFTSGLLLVGWVADRDAPVNEVFLKFDRKAVKAYSLSPTNKAVKFIRVFRPDVIRSIEEKQNRSGQLGFVIWLTTDEIVENKLAVGFDKSFASMQVVPLHDLYSRHTKLDRALLSAGTGLRQVASDFEISPLTNWLDDIEVSEFDNQAEQIAAVDYALVLFNKALLITGWIGAIDGDILKVEVEGQERRVDIKDRLIRLNRPDLFGSFPYLKPEPLGFVALVEEPELAAAAQLTVRVQTKKGQNKIGRTADVLDWPNLLSLINTSFVSARPILDLLEGSQALNKLPGFLPRFSTLKRAHCKAFHSKLMTSVDNPSMTLAAIDRVFALGKGGMLIFGWHFEPEITHNSVTVHGPDGQELDVSKKIFPLARPDVSHHLKGRFPQITDRVGFVCHVPLEVNAGECWALRFDFGGRGELWLKVEDRQPESNPLQQIKAILGFIPSADSIRGDLYNLFQYAIGPAIDSLGKQLQKGVPEVQERQFGVPPSDPLVTAIVPLYGRYDFIRHQLAQFVDDPDFWNVDLIYVVDDPSILSAALDMAAAYHQLFGQPFRVVWYGRNLGFAGANNVGARLARSDVLLLLNSDVIPRSSGWVSSLKAALDNQPQAGAVGPLLQFADDSVQHAGMRPKEDPFLPGFILNIHPGKGVCWTKPDSPTQHPLLTAACLMLRKRDYEAVNGFDEDYIIGDFEDSDLCLKLRKRNLTLWLIPTVRLWHLERQSQNLENISGYRQLLTLYNGWRYCEKIKNGELVDPREEVFNQ